MIKRYPDPDVDRVAGVFDGRVDAVLLDALLVGVLLVVASYVFGAITGGGLSAGVQFATVAAVPLFLSYYVWFEGRYGQTPGKAAQGLVVVHEDGSPCTWRGAALRNVLRAVDALPGLYIVGLVSLVATRDNRRLGDIGGRTKVVHRAK